MHSWLNIMYNCEYMNAADVSSTLKAACTAKAPSHLIINLYVL